jgi:hypothetical protein
LTGREDADYYDERLGKTEIPNHKHQAPSSNDPMTKTKKRNRDGFCLGHWNLELGIYLEFGICDLEF